MAILLNALAPSLAYAVNAAHGGSPVIEVCTADGIKYVTFDGSTPLKSPLEAVIHHLEHCPFCLGDVGAPPRPAPTLAPYVPTGGHALFPALFYHAPAPLFAWSQAHPRAPPFVA